MFQGDRASQTAVPKAAIRINQALRIVHLEVFGDMASVVMMCFMMPA